MCNVLIVEKIKPLTYHSRRGRARDGFVETWWQYVEWANAVSGAYILRITALSGIPTTPKVVCTPRGPECRIPSVVHLHDVSARASFYDVHRLL